MPHPKIGRHLRPEITAKVSPTIKSEISREIRSAPNRESNNDRLFHALGDPTRRAILDSLSLGPRSVSALAAPLGITLTAVAQHLQILEESSLVHTEKLGRVRTCRIETKGFSALEQWIRDHRSLWQRRLDQLSDLLAEFDESE
jgi:DNA-binding transcriptional ArsR family regulator